MVVPARLKVAQTGLTAPARDLLQAPSHPAFSFSLASYRQKEGSLASVAGLSLPKPHLLPARGWYLSRPPTLVSFIPLPVGGALGLQ